MSAEVPQKPEVQPLDLPYVDIPKDLQQKSDKIDQDAQEAAKLDPAHAIEIANRAAQAKAQLATAAREAEIKAKKHELDTNQKIAALV